MTSRLTTTTNTGTTAFEPEGETILQLDAVDASAKVTIAARVDVGANWVIVGELAGPMNRFLRLPQFPELQLSVARNGEGKALTVWSN